MCFVHLVLLAPLPSLKWHSVCSGPSTAPLQTDVLCVWFQSSRRSPCTLQAKLRPRSSQDRLQNIPTCNQSSVCSTMSTFCCLWSLMVRSGLSSCAVITAALSLSVLCWGRNWLELFQGSIRIAPPAATEQESLQPGTLQQWLPANAAGKNERKASTQRMICPYNCSPSL